MPADLVVFRLTAKRAARSGLAWGIAFGATVAVSAFGYVSAYPTVAERARVDTLFGANAGLAAVNGPAYRLGTVAGYTVWKSFMSLLVIGAIWGLLTATRLLRGEEDAGRWEMLASGRTTVGGATTQGVAGLGAGALALWVTCGAGIVVVGRSSKVAIGSSAALFFATALVAGAVTFLAVGALCSQVAETRRQANLYGGVVLGIAYALRMVGDSAPGRHWLDWCTPFGWAEQLRPVTGSRPAALVPVGILVAALAGAAIVSGSRRDLGARALARPGAHRSRRARRVGGATELAVRLAGPVLAGWVVMIGLWALLLGSMADSGSSLVTASPSVTRVVSRLGAAGGGAPAYLGFAFVILAGLVAFLAAGQVVAARREEASGRAEHLLVRRLSRSRWLIERLAVAAAAVVIAGAAAGLLAFAGASGQNAGVGLVTMLGAGINLVAPAICVLGLGVLALGAWPRATASLTYGVLAWSLLIEVAGGVGGPSRWVLDTSVFHHLAPAPAVTPDWTSAAAMVVTGLVAAALGAAAFSRRDLAGE